MSATVSHWEKFEIPSMDCAEEFRLISAGIQDLPGVEQLRADYLNRVLNVELDGARISRGEVASRLQHIGFPAADSLPVVSGGSATVAAARRRLAVVIGALLLFIAALAWFVDNHPWARTFAIASAVVSGWPVAKAAWRALRLGRIEMNSLMCIAAIGAMLVGEFFEAATAMFLFGVSLWLESLSVNRAQHAVSSLVGLMPRHAHKLISSDLSLAGLDAEGVEDVTVDHVHKGDRLLVRPGERIPADGVIIDGASTVNQAPITGESMPISKAQDDDVFAGSLNGESMLLVQASKCAHESTLAHVARLVDQARRSSSPTERFVDQFARLYTPAIVALACFMAIAVPLILSLVMNQPVTTFFASWFHRGLVMLVIACPCALVISTPITIVCGLHQATRLGILVKGGDHLEAAGVVRAIIVDKTGTMTSGDIRVAETWLAPGVAKDELLACAAALELHSEHPIAKAILRAATDGGKQPAVAEQAKSQRGAGVTGTWLGQDAAVGTRELFAELKWPVPEEVDRWMQSVVGTVVLVGTATRFLGAFRLSDTIRDDAAAAVSDWNKLGIDKITMLTGDRQFVADQVGQSLGIADARGDLLPAEKCNAVYDQKTKHEQVMMVGDGVNDAPALAAASVGVALGNAASDLALESADVVVLTPKVAKITDLIRLSRRTRRILWQNIGFAMAVKLLVLLLAAVGLATMWMAVAADVGASLIVIFNGMRVLTRA